MAKQNRVPLNRMVAPGTFDSVKSLAVELGCSEGEVIDRAVRQFVEDETPGERSEVPPELEAHVREVLERVKALPELHEIGTLLGHLIEPLKGMRAPSIAPPQVVPLTETGTGYMIQCRHCGERRFGATKFATICLECKAGGHTNAPGECPRCTEGAGI